MQESPLRRNISGQDLVLLWLLFPFVHLVFETGSFYVDQAGFELVSQLPNPMCWDSLCARPRLALFFGSVSSQNGVVQASSTSWSTWASPSLTCRLKCSLDTNFQPLTALPQSLLSSASVYQASTHALGCLVQSQALWASSCMAPLSLTSPSLGAVIPVTSLGR